MHFREKLFIMYHMLYTVYETNGKMKMEEITRKAYAKINLGLDVTGRRPDGYHEVRMVMQTIGIYDELLLKREKQPGIRIMTDHAEVPADETNLCYRAAASVLQRCGYREGISITLKKRIPVAAGMAGGSADGGAVFHGLNELLDLGLSLEELCEMGVKIGADVPFCIMGGTALAEGIGEKLTPLPSPPDCSLVIVKPDISVSTRWVYENLFADRLVHHPDINGMIEALGEKSLTGIAERMENVLETVTEKKYPVIGEIKAQMRELGADGALMSGSGPAVFGIFGDSVKARQAYDTLKQVRKEREIFLTGF